ncbi:MAG: HIT family protein [Campylobacter sp.]|nr:HIT family protein [Campylobacter sp.]
MYEDKFIYIEREISTIPWIKIFTQVEFKELSDCDLATLKALFNTAMVVEKTMIEFYKPDKINHASFANYLPRVHLHVMARFKNDSHFPESMWGKRQRKGKIDLPEFSKFRQLLLNNLTNKQ